MDDIILSIHPVPLGEDDRALWQYNYNHRSYTNSSRWGTSDWDKQDPVAYARALSGFVFALMIYFCVLFYLCDKYGDASKKTVDKSIVKKKVLPHGQSQLFRSADSESDAEREKNEGRCRCRCRCRSRQKDAVAPAPAETADDILEEYRAKSYLQRIRHHLPTAAQPTNATDDELVLAEEGAATNTEENVCPICIEQYQVGVRATTVMVIRNGGSESDRKACKSFCTKYSDRVASMKISDSLRIFFVTPGLQEQCRCLAGKTSRCPMVVVLKRKKGVL
ncbi:hypothetical protein ACHAXT_000645 [Thalassiosira profunda]